MKQSRSETLGTEPVGSLLIKQAIPASIGVLVMSLNILVDTIFVGNWIGSIAIAAINVVLPVSFFIAALGMAIGIGGSWKGRQRTSPQNFWEPNYAYNSTFHHNGGFWIGVY